MKAAVLAAIFATAAPLQAAGRLESRRAPARLSLAAAWSAVAEWLGAYPTQRPKACTATEDTHHIDPDGCPRTGETGQAATEGGIHIDPDG